MAGVSFSEYSVSNLCVSESVESLSCMANDSKFCLSQLCISIAEMTSSHCYSQSTAAVANDLDVGDTSMSATSFHPRGAWHTEKQ